MPVNVSTYILEINSTIHHQLYSYSLESWQNDLKLNAIQRNVQAIPRLRDVKQKQHWQHEISKYKSGQQSTEQNVRHMSYKLS